MLSPIVLFVYNRLEHTRKTIEALQKNELAKDSELFVYSDGPKNEENIKKVNEVRKYINSIDGFKKVKIVDSAEEVVKDLEIFLKNNEKVEKSLEKGSDHKFYVSDITPQLPKIAEKLLGKTVKLEAVSLDR